MENELENDMEQDMGYRGCMGFRVWSLNSYFLESGKPI